MEDLRTSFRLFAFAALAGMAASSHAELKSIDDTAMGDVVGQAAPMLELGGQMTYESIVYTDPLGNKEVITPGGSSTDGTVETVNMTLQGQMFGIPKNGSPLDLMTAIFPLRVGQVDTDGDGTADHGAVMFSFQPNVGLGTQFSPISVGPDRSTVKLNDQTFLTDQGIVFLNAPLDNIYEINGQQYQYTHPPKLF